MANQLIEWQFIIRNRDNTADLLECTSVRGGTNPYISQAPRGDGASFNPNTGVVTSGSFTGRIVDVITSGTTRLLTSLLEDANSRQQLGHLRAFWKYRVDGGSWTTLYAGRITRYALANDIEWEITVSDWMKAEHEFSIFDPDMDEPIRAFLARWPIRGCLCGGPIRGGFLTVPDGGGWEMVVRADAGSNRYRLEPLRIYDALGRREVDLIQSGLGANINKIAQELPHGIIRFETGEFNTIRDTQGEGRKFPGLVTLIDEEPWRPISPSDGQVNYNDLQNNQNALWDLISSKPGQTGLFVHRDDQTALTTGQVVRVRVLTILPSAISPIYLGGHPVDVLAQCWNDRGIPYDADSLETVRDTLGAQTDFRGDFTKAERFGPLVEQTIYGPFGIGARQGSDGEIETFCTRIFSTTVPSVTVDDDDVVDGSTRAFALDTSEAIRQVTFEHTKLVPSVSGSAAGQAFAKQVERFERVNDDPGAIGTGEVSYVVPGQVRIAETIEMQLRHWVDGRAYEVFDRYSRGPIRLGTTLLPTGSGGSVKLGDEILIDLPQVPNANKRMGDASVSARAMQIVHLTKSPEGIEVECIDSGPNAAPYGTSPTHTVAKSSDRPRNVAALTITNAATLNAASAGVRVQMAATTAVAPASVDYADVGFFEAGKVPTAAIRLPAVTAGLIVYARARAEKAGVRASAWSTPVSVALDAFAAPSAVTGTPNGSDATRADIVWTNGISTALVEVWLSLSSKTSADAKRVDTLPAGSDRYSMYDLTASTSYNVYIRHRDEETGDVSSFASDDFTTGGTPATLTAPTNPYGFSTFRRGTVRTFGLGPNFNEFEPRIGIVVKAAESVGFLEVQRAMEDSVGAGTYGAYSTVATQIPVVSGDWTMYTETPALNGLRRRFKARHVREGATASSYTSEVTVTPGSDSPIPQFPLNNLITTTLVDSEGRPVDSSQRMRVVLRNSAPLTVDSATDTDLTWNTEDADVGGLHSTASNTDRITIPTASGMWLINATILLEYLTTTQGAYSATIVHFDETDTEVEFLAFDVAEFQLAYLQLTRVVPAPGVGHYYKIRLIPTFDSNGNLPDADMTTSADFTYCDVYHLF